MKEFLVLYDYGQGGLWAVVRAKAKSDVETKFSGISVLDNKPTWMSDGEYQRVKDGSCHELNDLPGDTWLRDFLR